MANFRDYLKFAANHCPSLSYIEFSRAMLSSAREYFEWTQAWTVDVSIDVLADTQTYTIPTVNDDALVDAVPKVKLDNIDLCPISEGQYTERTGLPKHYDIIGKSEIALYPIPASDGSLTVTLSLKPSVTSNSLPDALFDEHFEGLIAGCIYQIKRMPGKWYDPQAAVMFEQDYRKCIDAKRIQIMRGDNNAELTISFPEFS